MLGEGRKRLVDHGLLNVPLVQANAEQLPFEEGSFDCITIGFGLRNVTDKDAALRSMTRCLKPGDRKSVVEGKSVSVRVDLGGRRIITKKNTKQKTQSKIHREKKDI